MPQTQASTAEIFHINTKKVEKSRSHWLSPDKYRKKFRVLTDSLDEMVRFCDLSAAQHRITEKILAICIATDGVIANMSCTTLAAKCRCSPTTLRLLFNFFEVSGLLLQKRANKWIEGGKNKNRNIYIFHLERFQGWFIRLLKPYRPYTRKQVKRLLAMREMERVERKLLVLEEYAKPKLEEQKEAGIMPKPRVSEQKTTKKRKKRRIFKVFAEKPAITVLKKWLGRSIKRTRKRMWKLNRRQND